MITRIISIVRVLLALAQAAEIYGDTARHLCLQGSLDIGRLRYRLSGHVAGCHLEVHPEPDKAKCDGPNMVALDDAEELFSICNEIFKLVRK